MDESPLVSPKIKEYINLHKLEDKLNEAVNEILKKLPDDPFSSLSNSFKKSSSNALTVNNVSLHKSLSSDFKPTLCIEVQMTFKGVVRKCVRYPLSYSFKSFEGLSNSIDLILTTFTNHLCKIITNYSFENFASFDKILRSFYDELVKENHNNLILAKFISNSVSMAVLNSNCLIQEISIKDVLKENLKPYVETLGDLHTNVIPNLGFCIFKCGKHMNSKVKFERFMIIINNSHKMKKDELTSVIQKLYASVKKVLTTGKQGVK